VSLTERVRRGETGAIARALSLVERGGPEAIEFARTVAEGAPPAAITGVTGPPGVGKSTLVGAIVRRVRDRDERVAVLSVDPSSPFTSGALLGDRIRLVEHFEDDGVFIRSLATRGVTGGLSAAVWPACRILAGAGFPEILVETVGVGQTEIEIIDHADTVVLVLMPGSGDSVQAIKAGVMEIPDVIAVNKADDPRAAEMARELRRLLPRARDDGWRTPVVCTVASDGTGVAELLDAVAAHRVLIADSEAGERRRRRMVERQTLAVAEALIGAELRRRLHDGDDGRTLLGRLMDGELDPGTAGLELVARLTGAVGGLPSSHKGSSL
jgi:LAO/AO transport system kinase